MVFSPSPALHRIRQLVGLIRKHPDLPATPRNSARRAPERSDLPLPDLSLPDPDRFVDSSASRSTVSGRESLSTRQKRANCPANPGRQ
jgi:hypothetical protein